MLKEISTNFKKLLLGALLLACVFGFTVPAITVAASEELAGPVDGAVISGQVVTVSSAASAYRDKDSSGEAAVTFNAGDSIYLTGEDGDWLTIFYKGEHLYIPKSEVNLADIEASQQQADELAAEVQEEIEAQSKEDEAYVNAYYKMNKSQRNARIWFGIIVFLVAAIVAVSVYIAIRNNKKDKLVEDSDDDVEDLDQDEDLEDKDTEEQIEEDVDDEVVDEEDVDEASEDIEESKEETKE